MNRGDRREPIYKDKPDYECFMQTLAEACVKANWQVHAFCLIKGSVNGNVIFT